MQRSDLPTTKKHQLRLPDGRQLTWYEYGPASGQPLLFCTGAGMSGSLGFGAASLQALNIRVIAPDRPGLGGSDPHPEKTLSSWCRDTAELLASQKITAPLCLGFSQGAPFAFALAHAGMVKALAIVSGQDDFAHAPVRAMLPPPAADFVEKVQSKNSEYLDGLARIASAEGFFQLILSMSSERDQSLYATEQFRSAYLRCLVEGFGPGPAGYIQDLVNALNPWPFAVEQIRVPVNFWYGELDANPTHSPDFGKTLSRRLPLHTHSLLKGEGGSLLWTRSDDILGKLAERSS